MKYRIDLSPYNFVLKKAVKIKGSTESKIEEKSFDLNVKDEIFELLHLQVYKDGVETCDGVALANKIKDCGEDFIDLDAKGLDLLKKVFDRLIERVSLGGPRYIVLIQRVFEKAEEVSVD